MDPVGVELERAVAARMAQIAAIVAEVVFLVVLLLLCGQLWLRCLGLAFAPLLCLGVMGLVSPVGGMF